MRPIDRMNAIERIASELQSRFTFSDLDVYLCAYGISPSEEPMPYNSKRVYAKQQLAAVEDSKIYSLIEDLDLGSPQALTLATAPPDIWAENKRFRLFISHVSKDKLHATRLRECLLLYGIQGFVAHEDIHPTKAWQNQIERGLFSMHAMVAVHTLGFAASHWTQQEVGVAVGRGVPIISIRFGEDPVGFISKHQALSRGKKTAEQVAAEVDTLLQADDRVSKKLLEAKLAYGLVEADLDEIPF